MKACIVARPGIGGAARVLEALLRRLPERGITGTAVLSGLEGTELLDAAKRHGWTTIRLDLSRAPEMADIAARRRLAEIIPGHDVVHAHAAKAGALVRLAPHSVPVIYAPHGFYFTYYAEGGVKSGIWKAIERRLAPRTTLFHCVSPTEAALCVTAQLCDAARAVALSNPVPPRGRAEPIPAAFDGSKIVLMAARLDDPKDPKTFFAAARRVDPALGARFVLCGDGPLLIPARRASEHVPHGLAWVLTGVRDIRGLLARTRVAVLSSRSEAMPIFLLEALAEGIPAAATDLPGCRDASGDAALYAPLGDADALSANITRLLSEDSLHSDLSAKARARAPLFTEDRWLDGVVAMYERATGMPAS